MAPQTLLKVATVALFVLFAGCTTVPETPEDDSEPTRNWHEVEIKSNESYGSRIYRVNASSSMDVLGSMDWHWRLDEFNTVGIMHLADNGSVQPILAGYEYDDQHNVGGSDPVHVGTPAGSIGSPAVATAGDIHVQGGYGAQTAFGDGWVIVYWANLNQPLYLNATIFGSGLQVEEQEPGEVISYTHRSGDTGFHVSTPGALVAYQDSIRLAGTGASVITSMRVLISDTGIGSLSMTGKALRETVSLNGVDYMEASCVVCFHSLRVAAYDPAAMNMALNYGGNNRQTQILGAAVLLPAQLAGEAGYYQKQLI